MTPFNQGALFDRSFSEHTSSLNGIFINICRDGHKGRFSY
jgi:hypothetical protein